MYRLLDLDLHRVGEQRTLEFRTINCHSNLFLQIICNLYQRKKNTHIISLNNNYLGNVVSLLFCISSTCVHVKWMKAELKGDIWAIS